MSDADFHRNVARFLYGENESVVGTGVILHGGWVVTCAHVAAAAATGSKKFDRIPPHGTIHLDIAESAKRRKLSATFNDCIWGPATEEHWRGAGDYTFLKLLDEDVPTGLVLARTSIAQLRGEALYSYGFPKDYRIFGRSASLKTANSPFAEGDGLVRIHRDNVRDEFIAEGFSGAPVLATNQDYSVVGLIKSFFIESGDNVEEAYLIPGTVLHRAFGEISLRFHKEWLRRESRLHPLRADVQSTASFHSSFGLKDLKLSKLVARGWRYVPERFSSNSGRDLGLGAALVGGRFNRPNMIAAYFALSAESAIEELNRHVSTTEAAKFVLQTYEISCDNIFDARDPKERQGLYLAIDPIVQRQDYRRPSAITHDIADWLHKNGFSGLIYPSLHEADLPGANLVLWDIDDKLNNIRLLETRVVDGGA